SFFIRTLGEELLGISGTFTNVINILSVTELGIGGAITFCLYKPIFDEDEEKIAGIMNLFRKAYFVIGTIVLLAGLCVLPFVQYLLKDYTLDLSYIRLIFMMYVVNTTLSYYLAHCRTLFFASQRNYVVTIVDFIAKTLMQVGQIVILLKTRNFTLYLSLMIVYTVSTNLIIHQLYYKNFSFMKGNKTVIDPSTREEVFSIIKYLAINSLVSIGVFSTDNLIISAIIGVGVVGIYSNYTMIIQNIQTLFTSLLNGVVASLGNMMAEGDDTRINKIFNIYDFSYYIAGSFTTVSLFCMLNPFIRNIWIRKEEYVLSILIVVVLCFNHYMILKRQPVWQYQNTSGVFRYFLPYSFMEMVVNLAVSIFLAYKIGLIGVFLGSTTAYILSWIGQTWVIHQRVLKRNALPYYLKQIFYILLTVLMTAAVYALDQVIVLSNPYLDFFVNMCFCALVPNLINLILFHKTEEFAYLKENVVRRLLRLVGKKTA
ncbi:MAG: hypothetical protein IIZ47_02630, partial [Erysipelotrichaceae bacterium]|nr:hypothetical protein [Erysipelotrichaceae bacterium]